jgi:hypothetical protein
VKQSHGAQWDLPQYLEPAVWNRFWIVRQNGGISRKILYLLQMPLDLTRVYEMIKITAVWRYWLIKMVLLVGKDVT